MQDTRTAAIVLTEGVVTVRVRPGAQQTVADAQANIEAALTEAAGRRSPILVDITVALTLDAEVRRYYSGTVLIDGFTAMALLVKANPLGRMIGNIYLRVANTLIPTRLFNDEPAAREWL